MAYDGYGYSNYSQYYTGQQAGQSASQQSNSTSQAYQNPYSPYYQPTGQYAQQSSEREQEYQNKPAIENPNFQSSYYSQPQYQQTAATENTNAYSQSQSYLPTTQATASNYGYTSQASSDQPSRSYADNSALGNLAYASTLGRSSPAAGQPQLGSRQQSSMPTYQMRQDSAQYQQPPASKLETAAQLQRTRTPGTYANPREASRQPQSQQISQAPSAPLQYRPNHPAQSRPTSAMSQQAVRSPSVTQRPRTGQQQSAQASAGSAPAAKPALASARSTQKNGKSSKAHQISAIMNQNEPPAIEEKKPSVYQGEMQSYTDSSQGRDTVNSAPTPTDEVQPATIDPNQVFDHAEYQRRKRAAEEAEAARNSKKNESTNIAQQLPQHQGQSPTVVQAQSTLQDGSMHTRTESQAREHIQAEMKAMIDKMRKYKAEDPTGFSEMWEQFKKVQPPQPARVASQTPQLGKAFVTLGSTSGTETAVLSPNADAQAFPSPVMDMVPSAGEAEGEGQLPDLGKFPAMRRRRRNDKGIARVSKGTTTTSPQAGAQIAPPTKTPGSRANIKPQALTSPADAGAESMRRAMQAFHNTPTPTPSSQQSSPPVQSPRSTIWPEEKKPLLAEFAKKFLEGLEVNKGKFIASSEIHTMLNQNPSYDQLCGLLNARGFHFSRAPFAKTLLSVVPQNGASDNAPKMEHERARKDETASSANGNATPRQNQPSSGTSVKWHSNLTQAAVSAQKGKKRNAGNSGSPTNVVSPVLPTPNGPNSIPPEYKSYYEKMRMITGGSPSSSAPAPTKQQAARKRNFSEIVDLSQLSDDESQAKKHQSQRPGNDQAGKEQAISPIVGSGLILTSSGPSQSEAIDPNLENSTKHSYVSTGDLPADPQPGYFDRFRLEDDKTGSLREKLRNAALVKPINAAEALKNRHINVSTLARDILISKGEHPRERPLNFHMRDLALNFKSVTTKSDLSTFRWEFVDPGGPPPGTVLPSLEGVSDSENPDDMALALNVSSKDSNRIDAAAHNEQPKRFDSILTRGRGRRGRPRVRGLIFGTRSIVDYKPQNEDQEPKPDPIRGGLVSRRRPRARDASRIVQSSQQTRSEKTPATFIETQPNTLITQHQSQEENNKVTSTSQRSSQTIDRAHVDAMEVDSPSDTQDEAVMQESPRRNLMVAASADVLQDPPNLVDQLPMNSSPKSIRISSQSLNPIQQVQKRRGRPPKVKTPLESSHSTPSKVVPSQSPDSGSVPRKRGRPPGSKNSPFAPKRPGQSTESGHEVNNPKKPGRPPKPRDEVNTEVPVDGIGIVVPSPSSSLKDTPLSYIEPRFKRPKKAWKAVNQYADEDPDTDQYIQFPCSWGDCTVKLHNLDTLKKHVKNVHISQPQKSADGALHCYWIHCPQNQIDFGDPVLLEEHLDERHITQMASSLGDGPSTHPAVVDPSVYLCDSTGRQVTPYARAVGRPDPLPLHAGLGPTKAYHKAHGNITQEAKMHALRESIRTHIERGNLPPDAQLAGSDEEGTDEEDDESEEENGTDEDTQLGSQQVLDSHEVTDSAISDSDVP